MSNIVLFIAKQSFLDASVMSQMFIKVYYNLGINTEQFQTRPNWRSAVYFGQISTNHHCYLKELNIFEFPILISFCEFGAFEIVLYWCNRSLHTSETSHKHPRRIIWQWREQCLTFASEHATFWWIFCRYSNHCSSQNGAFRGLDASECFDIIGEVTLGSIEEIAQVGTQLVFTAFKRAIFKIWKSRIREFSAENGRFWAFNRAKMPTCVFGAFKAS